MKVSAGAKNWRYLFGILALVFGLFATSGITNAQQRDLTYTSQNMAAYNAALQDARSGDPQRIERAAAILSGMCNSGIISRESCDASRKVSELDASTKFNQGAQLANSKNIDSAMDIFHQLCVGNKIQDRSCPAYDRVLSEKWNEGNRGPSADCRDFYAPPSCDGWKSQMEATLRQICDPPIHASFSNSLSMCGFPFTNSKSRAREPNYGQSSAPRASIGSNTQPNNVAPTNQAAANSDRSRVIAGNGTSAMSCASVVEIPGGNNSQSSGGRVIRNNCNRAIEAVWCYNDGDCQNNGGAQWTIEAGHQWTVSKTRPIHWAACIGANTVRFERGSQGTRFICDAPSGDPQPKAKNGPPLISGVAH